MMVSELKKEEKDEVKLKDWCREEENQNLMEEHAAQVVMGDDETLKTKLSGEKSKLADAIAKLEEEIAVLQKDLKSAGEDRDKQRKEFQTTVMDQKATKKVLRSALQVLKQFYARKAAALVQVVPAGGDDYQPSGAAGKVMNMIQNIIDEAQAMQAEAERDEAAAEKEFDEFTEETEKTIAMKNKAIANKKGTKGDTQGALVVDKKDISEDLITLERLHHTNTTLHQDCDFTMNNFAVRQDARHKEVEALKQAMGILSGSKFEAFLQHA